MKTSCHCTLSKWGENATIIFLVLAAIFYSVSLAIPEFVRVTVTDGEGNECLVSRIGVFRAEYDPTCPFYSLPGEKINTKSTDFWPLFPAQNEFGQSMQSVGVTFAPFTGCDSGYMQESAQNVGNTMGLSDKVENMTATIMAATATLGGLVGMIVGSDLTVVASVDAPIDPDVSLYAFNPTRTSQVLLSVLKDMGLTITLPINSSAQDWDTINQNLAGDFVLLKTLTDDLKTSCLVNSTVNDTVTDCMNGNFVDAMVASLLDLEAPVFGYTSLPAFTLFLSDLVQTTDLTTAFFAGNDNAAVQLINGQVFSAWNGYAQLCMPHRTPAACAAYIGTVPLIPDSVDGDFCMTAQITGQAGSLRDMINGLAKQIGDKTLMKRVKAGALQAMMATPMIFNLILTMAKITTAQFDSLVQAASLVLTLPMHTATLIELLLQIMPIALTPLLVTMVGNIERSMGDITPGDLLDNILAFFGSCATNAGTAACFGDQTRGLLEVMLGGVLFNMLYLTLDWDMTDFNPAGMETALVAQCKDSEKNYSGISAGENLIIASLTFVWIAAIICTAYELSRVHGNRFNKRFILAPALLTLIACATAVAGLLTIYGTPIYGAVVDGPDICPSNKLCYRVSTSVLLIIIGIAFNIFGGILQVVRAFICDGKVVDIDANPHHETAEKHFNNPEADAAQPATNV